MRGVSKDIERIFEECDKEFIKAQGYEDTEPATPEELTEFDELQAIQGATVFANGLPDL